MSTLFIKGTVIGYDYEKWQNDPDSLATWLICMVETWHMAQFSATGEFLIDHPDEVKKKYGEVRGAIQAFTNDIHSLSVCYHQMLYVLNDPTPEVGLKTLYLSNLVESYITNVRTIYDLMAVFARIVVSTEYLKLRAVSTDSLSDLLKTFENKHKWSIEIFSEPVVSVFKSMRGSLNMIREIRNSIIHDGKEPIVTIKQGVAYFRIPKTINSPYETSLPDLLDLNTPDYPLFPYLQHVTRTLFTHMDNLGRIIGNDAHLKDNDYRCELPVLIGICIPEFMEFIHKDYNELATETPTD
ncbi:MAG: hypothetical protein V4594_25300 [Bacteroidota bacterium]